MLALPLLSALLCFAPDDLVMVHDPPQGKFFATHYEIDDYQSVQTLGPLVGSYLKCFSEKGKQPVRAVFAIDRNGDGDDELAFVRAWKESGRHFLQTAEAPESLSEKKPNVVTSTKRAFLTRIGSVAEFVAAGRIDRDGDGIDEWIAVERNGNDEVHFAVRSLPTKKSEEMPPIFAETVMSESSLGGRIVAAFGSPFDTTVGDELILAIEIGDEVHCVVFSWPTGSGQVPAQLVDLGSVAKASEFLGVGPARVGAGLAPGVLTMLNSASLGPEIESREILAAGTLSAPVLDFGTTFWQVETFAAIGLRRNPSDVPPPPGGGGGSTPKTWTLFVYNGENLVGTFKPGAQNQSSLVFLDDNGVGVTVVPIASGGYESSFIVMNPTTFTWQLKVGGTGATATIAVTSPLGQGSAGFHSISGMHVVVGSADMNPAGTLSIPGAPATPFTRLWFNLPHN
jgi:hypothetical protein